MTNIFFKIITLQYWGPSPDLDWTWTRPRVQVWGLQKVARPDLDWTVDSLMSAPQAPIMTSLSCNLIQCTENKEIM